MGLTNKCCPVEYHRPQEKPVGGDQREARERQVSAGRQVTRERCGHVQRRRGLPGRRYRRLLSATPVC